VSQAAKKELKVKDTLPIKDITNFINGEFVATSNCSKNARPTMVK
jgi:hypothetical protein